MESNERWVYEIWDSRTGLRVGKWSYINRGAANKKADKLNLEYGAHRYCVDGKYESTPAK